MDMGTLLKLGAAAFQNSNGSGNAGSGLDIGSIVGALSGLTGNSEEGGINITEIMGNLTNNETGESVDFIGMAQSWLGDSDNEPASSDSITEMLGSDKLSEFAAKLGITEEEAVGGLQDALPQMVDQGSSGGSLLDSIGGISGAINLASKFLK